MLTFQVSFTSIVSVELQSFSYQRNRKSREHNALGQFLFPLTLVLITLHIFFFNQRENAIFLQKIIDEKSALLCPVSMDLRVGTSITGQVSVGLCAGQALFGVLLIQNPDAVSLLVLNSLAVEISASALPWKGYIKRLRKCHGKVIRELNEVLKTALTSLAITAAVTIAAIATAGAFAPSIAVAFKKDILYILGATASYQPHKRKHPWRRTRPRMSPKSVRQDKLNQAARQGLSATIRFAMANSIFSLALCLRRPR